MVMIGMDANYFATSYGDRIDSFQALSASILTPKGSHSSAQGNALGPREHRIWHPNGVRPFSWYALSRPFRAREPQWLGTKFTTRRKGEVMKGG